MTDPDRTLPTDRQGVDAILARVLQGDLSLIEAGETVAQLHRAGRDVVSELLVGLDAPHSAQRAVAAALLGAVGDPRVISALVDRVRDPAVDDVLKIRLITAVLELDPSMDVTQLSAYLRDTHTALRSVRREHLQLLQSPQDLAIWLESIEVELSPDMRVELIHDAVQLGDPAAVPMLICLCSDPDIDVALAAIDAVERFKDIRALRPLHELAKHHSHPDMRREARKAVVRLRIRAALTEPLVPQPVAPVHTCYLTPVDGLGGQVAIIVRRSADARFSVLSLIFDDQEGIKLCEGIVGIDRRDFERLLFEYATQSLVLVPVAHEHCLAALDAAVDTSWHAGGRVPMSYLAWRELIEFGRPAWPAASTTLLVPPERRARLFARCDELLFQDEFRFWLFRPDEIVDLRARYLNQASQRGGRLDKQTLRGLLCQGVREVVTDRRRAHISGRLSRMAPLLRELYAEREVWQWAVVAAEALAEGSGLPTQEHPFLLGMLACSLENALGTPIGWYDAP